MGTQVVYIEYAFLENALLDGALLLLALRYSGCQRNALYGLAAVLGGVVAVVYPLLPIGGGWGLVYKVATGALLPLIASWKEKGSKTSLCVALFFAFSFFVAGCVFALAYFLPLNEGYYLASMPLPLVAVGVIAAACLLIEIVKKKKRRKEMTDFLVDCDFFEGQVRAKGFIDTGNRARCHGLPVCFVTPALLAKLPNGNQVQRTKIKTVTGEKQIAIVKVRRLRITQGGQTHIIKGVYLSPSLALCGREYEMLLGAWACGLTDGSEWI